MILSRVLPTCQTAKKLRKTEPSWGIEVGGEKGVPHGGVFTVLGWSAFFSQNWL